MCKVALYKVLEITHGWILAKRRWFILDGMDRLFVWQIWFLSRDPQSVDICFHQSLHTFDDQLRIKSFSFHHHFVSSFSPQSVSSLALHLCNSTFFWQHSSRPSQQFAPPLPHVSPPLLFGQVNTHLTVVNSISLHLSLNWFETIESQRLGTPPLPLSALKHRHKKGRVWFKANSF